VAVAITAYARDEDRTRALLAGYQAHLVKPYQIGQLVLIVDDLLGPRLASEVRAAPGQAGRRTQVAI